MSLETTTLEKKAHPHPAAKAPNKSGMATSVIGFVALLGALFAAGVLPRLQHGAALKAQTQEASGVRTVTVVTPIHASGATDLSLPGSIEAVEQTAVNSRSSGYVKHWYADIGAKVKQGQLLADIASPEIDGALGQAEAEEAKAQAQVVQSKAALGTAQAGVQQARAEVVRLQSLIAQTTSDAAKAQATVSQARAEESRAQAGVSSTTADVAKMRAMLGQAKAASSRAKASLGQAREDLGTRKANLLRAKADMEIAKKTAERWAGLVKEGAVSGQEADEKRAAYEARQADVSAAAAAVNSAQANVEAAQASLEASQSDIQAAEESIHSSQANVQAAQAGVGSGQANVLAMQSSAKSSESSIEAAKAALQSGKANVNAAQERADAAKADVSAAEAALASQRTVVRRYHIMQSWEEIRAPYDGVIMARNVDVGTLVNAGGANSGGTTASPTTQAMHSGMFAIARTDTMRIQVNVPQTFVENVKAGEPAQVSLREFAHREFTGQIFRTGGALDPSSRTMLVEVRIANKEGLLKPGMYADVKLTPAGETRAIHVPANTLVIGTEGTRVAVVTPDHHVKYQQVELGQDLGNEVEITKGLTGSEELVENPTDELTDGAAVKVAPAAPAEKKEAGAEKKAEKK